MIARTTGAWSQRDYRIPGASDSSEQPLGQSRIRRRRVRFLFHESAVQGRRFAAGQYFQEELYLQIGRLAESGSAKGQAQVVGLQRMFELHSRRW